MFASSGHHGPSTRRPARGAGSCEHPATTNGPWILAATILGSSMAFIDGSVVNVAVAGVYSRPCVQLCPINPHALSHTSIPMTKSEHC